MSIKIQKLNDVPLAYLNHLKRQAERKKFDFNLTLEDLDIIYRKQNGKCALSGWDIKFGYGLKRDERTASLDRIDSSKGYIKGNIQFLHKDINILKNNHDQDYFIYLCELISINNKDY